MPHIHTAPGQVDHTVSFFILNYSDRDEPRLTFHRHRKSGKLQMFGGHIELNETPWGALLHELTEETGYEPQQLKLYQPIPAIHLPGAVVHPQPLLSSTGRYPGEDSHYHSDSLYLLLTDEEPLGTPEEGESLELYHFTLDELEAHPEDDFMAWCREYGFFILESVWTGLAVDYDHDIFNYLVKLSRFSGALPE